MHPTIYIPSQLTRLLIPLRLSQREVPLRLVGLLGPGGHRPASSEAPGQVERPGPRDWRGCSYRWTDSRSLCTG
jgi:hypothetical protein